MTLDRSSTVYQCEHSDEAWASTVSSVWGYNLKWYKHTPHTHTCDLSVYTKSEKLPHQVIKSLDSFTQKNSHAKREA